MHPILRLALVLPFALACAALPAVAQVAGAVDPIVWAEAKTRPAFREVLKAEEFTKQLDAAALATYITDLAKVVAAPLGCEIVEVLPGQMADSKGIKAGDMIVIVDGRPQWNNHLRKDVDQTMIIASGKDGKRRTVVFPAGGIGAAIKHTWRPELIYIRSKQRNPKWDRQVIAGILSRVESPDFAETAWHHAIAAGYRPDFLSDQCGMEIAHAQGRSQAALEFGSFALRADPKKSEYVNPMSIIHAAMANFKLAQAMRIMEVEPWAYEHTIDAVRLLMLRHAEQSAVSRARPAPSERYAQLTKTDLIPTLGPLNDAAKKMDLVKWLARKPPELKAASSRYVTVVYGPSKDVRDMELLVRFRFRPFDDQPSQFAKIMQVGIMDTRSEFDRNKPPYFTQATLMADMDYNGFCSVLAANLRLKTAWRNPSIRGDGKTEHEIRLLRFDGRGEAFFNGKRVLYLPLREEINRMDIMLKAVGTHVEFTQLKVVALSE